LIVVAKEKKCDLSQSKGGEGEGKETARLKGKEVERRSRAKYWPRPGKGHIVPETKEKEGFFPY